MSRIVFALNELAEEIGRLDPRAGKVVLQMQPITFNAVAGEVANQLSGQVIGSAIEVDMGKIVLRAVHG